MSCTKLLKASVLFTLLLISHLSHSQDKTITGRVTDPKDGSGIGGVNVTPKGSTGGVQTAADGSYRISIAPSVNVLIFSSAGFTRQEVNIAGRSTVDVTLAINSTSLGEVVVIGYGTARKRDVTGSVSKIGEKDLNQGPITNPLQQIAGRAAGVSITQVGSEPGVAPSVRIRGITSLGGGNDPLVVVDGIQGNLDLLNQVPPSEIESVDILKDASATAIYGSRGAPGVIIITTKKGRAGRSTLEYSGTAAVETIAKKYEMLDAAEWRAAAAQRGITGADYGGNTDWFDLMSRNGYTQNHTIAFGGGANDFSYRASLTAILQDGLLINSGLKNYIGRIQATQRALNDRLALTFNVNTGIVKNKWNGPGNIPNALQRRPTDPVYYKNTAGQDSAYFTDPNAFAYTNPYARSVEMIDGTESNSLFGSLKADLEIVKGLTAGFFGSWRKLNGLYGSYASARTTRPDAIQHKGIAQRNTNTTNERLMDLSLNYKKVLKGHTFDVIGVYEWQKAIYEGFAASGRGFVNDLLTFNSLQSADLTKAASGDITSYKNDRTIVSFLGRVNYNFLNKYFLTASFRRDGSSVFGENHKWGNFPAVSAAWKISGEDFMRDQQIFDDLKLRVGYGVTGNQQGLGALNSVLLVGPNGTTFFGGQLIPDFTISQNENKDLRWETKKMSNIGLDFALLKNRLTGTLDYYQGKTEDLLFDYTVPQPPYPFGTIKANVGTIMNTGFEATLSYQLIQSNDLNVTLAGNFTTNKNEVQELSGTLNGVPLKTDTVRWGGGGTTGVASTNNGISYLIKGQPIGTFFLFKHAGVDANGNQLIEDLNKNGVIDDNDRSPDRYIAGQALPKFTYAFTPSMNYKNFDMGMLWRGAYGHKIYNARKATLSALAQLGQQNVLKDALAGNINNIDYASDYWLEDGSFLRLEQLTVGYRFPIDNKYLSGIRVSLTGNNLAVFSDYSGIDPELRADGGNGFGIDGGIYPRTRSFAVGLNVIFK
ncbi:MAG: SusC/RagA family TonB-linked outer membrane protein [Chitinophagaceae bacterium]|nr:SusC/RagA family TonB-linked outer membrane protein [Chitinophagaceae bacterium]